MTAIYQKHKDQTSSVGEKLILFLGERRTTCRRYGDLYKKDTNNSILLNVFLNKYDNKRTTSNCNHTDFQVHKQDLLQNTQNLSIFKPYHVKCDSNLSDTDFIYFFLDSFTFYIQFFHIFHSRVSSFFFKYVELHRQKTFILLLEIVIENLFRGFFNYKLQVKSYSHRHTACMKMMLFSI